MFGGLGSSVSSFAGGVTNPFGLGTIGAAGLGAAGLGTLGGIDALLGGRQAAKQAASKAEIDKIMAEMKADPYKYKTFLTEQGMLPEELTSKDVMDVQALEKLRGLALSEGETPWAAMAREQQRLEEKGAYDIAAKQQLGALQGAQAQLAMRGGLRGGAAERLAGAGQKNLLAALQGVRQAGMQARAGIGTEEASRKLGILQAMPGMETQAATYRTGVEQFNLGNIMQERARQEQANLAAWQERQKMRAAEMQSKAMLSQEPKGLLGGGGFLGLGI